LYSKALGEEHDIKAKITKTKKQLFLFIFKNDFEFLSKDTIVSAKAISNS
jgi:hypothetical protein